jgi:hypothetical protein
VPLGGLVRSLGRELDSLVEATPADRDRFVDLLRAGSILVVILWHWTLSITQWEGGELVQPNPIDAVPGAEYVTWVLQVMPVFFFVGGFANLRGWRSNASAGGGAVAFWRKRAERLLLPTVVFVAAWVVIDVVLRLVGARSVLEWGFIVFVPLWFLAAYIWVVALVPFTARLHEWGGVFALVLLAVPCALVDLGRFVYDVEWFGYLNSALVWVFVHQLGYFYGDRTLERIGWRGQASLALAAVAALVVLTSFPDYPRSMVATEEVDLSHMFPTTAVIGVVAMFQAGVAMLLHGTVNRWLERRRVWKAVIGLNAVIMTVFLWHMTAYVGALGIYEAAGYELLTEPTARWWAQRPLWVLGPALLLAPLVAVFSGFELRGVRSDDG